MADSNFTFTAADVYTFIPDVTETNIHDHLTSRISMLAAMLLNVTGESFEVFNGLNNTAKHDYLWGCESLAAECRMLVNKL